MYIPVVYNGKKYIIVKINKQISYLKDTPANRNIMKDFSTPTDEDLKLRIQRCRRKENAEIFKLATFALEEW